MNNPFSLKGKIALVTGATGGIGRQIVETLCNNGAKVLATGTKEQALKDLKDNIKGEIETFKCDLSDIDEVNHLIPNCIETFGDIDILVCNAGITKDNLAIRMKDEDFDSVIDINLKSNFVLAREALKIMFKKRKGRLIFISSVVAHSGNFGQANYVASKAALVGLAKNLATEVASRNITVNDVAPGFIKTPMTASLKDEIKEKMLERIPCKKFGKPEDVANAVLFLASDEAQYINGQTIHVNGGMYM